MIFNEGYSGDVDLAAESIRLTWQLAAAIDHPEVAGLLALMLLHHARRATRTAPDGSLVPLAEQYRGRWDTESIAEGVEILQAALARDRLGVPGQAAIAALHADAPTAEEAGWVQIVGWYDELARLTERLTAPPHRPWPPTSTSATATLRRRHGCTPGPPKRHPTSPSMDQQTRQPQRTTRADR